MSYLKYLVFYLLEFLGSGVNFFASIIKAYPKLELGTAYLIRLEEGRIYSQNKSRGDKREEYAGEAERLLGEAKKSSHE